MTKLETVLHTAKAYTTGGRAGGASRTDDGQSAIFLSMNKLAGGKKKDRVPADLAIDAEVDLGNTGDAYGLATASTSACRVWTAKLLRNWSDAAEQLRGLR